MDVQFYRDALRQHGVGPTLYHAAFRAVNHVAEVAMLHTLDITPAMVDRKVAGPALQSARLLDAEAMRPFVADPTNMLPRDFIDEASRKGDRCCAFFDAGALVSYGWYSTRPTRLLDAEGSSPVLQFNPSQVYMYHAYTRPSHRGRRLHAAGMTGALDAYAREGHEGLIAYVDSSNLASLKSFYRMGFVDFGRLVVVRTGARYRLYMTPGCKKHGLGIADA